MTAGTAIPAPSDDGLPIHPVGACLQETGAVVIMFHNEQDHQTSEMRLPPPDPRSVCNLMLDEAAGRTPITNLALQKLLYFAHGIFLVEMKRPLVFGYFEAWKMGPVHPTAYMAFKAAGRRPIDFRAVKQDPLSGATLPIANPADVDVVDCVRRVISTYGRQTPGRLVDVSHAPGAPWDFIVQKARTTIAFGLRIPDNVIAELFKYHKMSVGVEPRIGEPSEDTPFA